MRWWQRLNLRSKIALGISLTMIIILGGGFFGINQYIRAQLWAQEVQAAQNLNAVAANLIEDAMMAGRKDIIQDTLEQLGTSVGGEINSIAVYDDQATLTSFASGFPGGMSVNRVNLVKNFTDKTCIECHQLPAEDRPEMIIVSMEGRDVLRSVVPLYNEARCQTCHGAGLTVLGDSIVDLRLDRYQQSSLTVTFALGSGILIALILVAFVLFELLNRIVLSPLNDVVDVSQAVVLGKLDQEVSVRSDDEIGVLAKAFNAMTRQLRSMIGNLEIRVNERTYELEYRTQQIQTAAEVGSTISAVRDMNLLLPQVTQLISERFGFYHVGIFLLDTNREFAILTAANSEGGKRMLERRHQLKVGEQGIVGFVTENKVPRIALDVGADAVHFQNPDLPETRSEMALPLIAGGVLLGALDIQSKKAAAFSDEDVEILQVVANQVSTAIENANLFSETQSALETIQRLFGEQSQAAWKKRLKDQKSVGYHVSGSDIISPVSGEWSPEMMDASQKGEIVQVGDSTIAIPIVLRGQVLGAVRLSKRDRNETWTKDEIELMDGLVDQLEFALESARLYEETQHRATYEQLTREITSRVRETLDIETILKTAASEISNKLGLAALDIQLNTATNSENSKSKN